MGVSYGRSTAESMLGSAGRISAKTSRRHRQSIVYVRECRLYLLHAADVFLPQLSKSDAIFGRQCNILDPIRGLSAGLHANTSIVCVVLIDFVVGRLVDIWHVERERFWRNRQIRRHQAAFEEDEEQRE